MEHVQSDIGEIKTDIRELRGGVKELHDDNRKLILLGIGAAAFILVAFTAGYLRLADQMGANLDRLTQLQILLQHVSDTVKATPGTSKPN